MDIQLSQQYNRDGTREMTWWQKAVFYQVYPSSFQDSNGDGIGDLPGIRHRLDYFLALGVDAIWLSPVYSSPMKDFGYDISDFCRIHEMFADLQIFDSLLAAAHERDLIETCYQAIPENGWPNFVFGNHDVHRLASRFGPENHRSVAMLLLTLWGIPTIYFGDELGMQDVEIPPELEVDPRGLNQPGTGLGRDPERTPMQWDITANAGFTTGQPWLPLSPHCSEVDVACQHRDEHSTFNFYRKLLRLRRELPALVDGSVAFVDGLPDALLGYVRERHDQRLLVLINYGSQAITVNIDKLASSVTTLISTRFSSHDGVVITLRPHESVLLQLKP